jgi:hypothetical protein
MAYRLGSPASIAEAEANVRDAEERLNRQRIALRSIPRYGHAQQVKEAMELLAVLTKTLESARQYLRRAQDARQR